MARNATVSCPKCKRRMQLGILQNRLVAHCPVDHDSWMLERKIWRMARHDNLEGLVQSLTAGRAALNRQITRSKMILAQAAKLIQAEQLTRLPVQTEAA